MEYKRREFGVRAGRGPIVACGNCGKMPHKGRSCDIDDAIKTDNTQALLGRIKELEARCKSLTVENFFILQDANAEHALSIAPATKQSLAEIQADAIEGLLSNENVCLDYCSIQDIKRHVQQLREQQ